jgi:hypothetical protein
MRTRFPHLLAAVLVLTGCSGKTLYKTYSGVAPETIPDSAYACSARSLEGLGFKRFRYNPETREFIGRRNSQERRESLVLARRWFDQMELSVLADSVGGSVVNAKGSTFQETNTQRGPTLEQLSVYKDVKGAADSMFAKCGVVAKK